MVETAAHSGTSIIGISDSDESAMLDVLRRAVVERDTACWQWLYDRFTPRVVRWTGLSASSPLDRDEIVAVAWERFVRSFTTAKLAEGGVAGAAAYLKCCARGAAIDAWRAANREATLRRPWTEATIARLVAPGPEGQVAENDYRRQLWEAIAHSIRSADERVAMQLTYAVGLRPAQIQLCHSDLFPNVAAVYRALRLVHDRLRRSRSLRVWYEEAGA